MKVKFNAVGRIVKGDESGHYVKVINDVKNTGGFLILTSKTSDMTQGFDNWVENETLLYRFFEECGWRIQWQD